MKNNYFYVRVGQPLIVTLIYLTCKFRPLQAQPAPSDLFQVHTQATHEPHHWFNPPVYFFYVRFYRPNVLSLLGFKSLCSKSAHLLQDQPHSSKNQDIGKSCQVSNPQQLRVGISHQPIINHQYLPPIWYTSLDQDPPFPYLQVVALPYF